MALAVDITERMQFVGSAVRSHSFYDQLVIDVPAARCLIGSRVQQNAAFFTN